MRQNVLSAPAGIAPLETAHLRSPEHSPQHVRPHRSCFGLFCFTSDILHPFKKIVLCFVLQCSHLLSSTMT